MDKIEITPELLADLKGKAEKATPGPWELDDNSNASGEIFSLGGNPACGYTDEDAAYIAAANPQVVLALIEYIERLKEDFDTAARSAAEKSVKAVRLEEEANWLAERLVEACIEQWDCRHCLRFEEPDCNRKICTADWRGAARKAIDNAYDAAEAEQEARER